MVTVDEEALRWRRLEQLYLDSPIHRELGLSLHVAGPGSAIVTFDGTDAARNRHMNPHGGALALMIDSVVVQTVQSMLDLDHISTIEMKANFVRPGPKEGGLIARAELLHLGQMTAVGEGRVNDMDGGLVAVGLVTVAIRRRRKGFVSDAPTA